MPLVMASLEHDPKKLQAFWKRSCGKTKRVRLWAIRLPTRADIVSAALMGAEA